jgi:hypothetical protein
MLLVMSSGDGASEVSVATWNMHFNNAGHRALAYLESASWDIACLQEVNRGTSDLLKQRDDWSVVNGLELASEQLASWKRPHAAALVARNSWTLADGQLVIDTPTPGRGVTAVAGNGVSTLGAISWHAPNFAGEGHETKMAGYRAVIAAIKAIDGPLVVGLDSNHWSGGTELESPAAPAPGSRFEEENRFFSAEPQHRLRDALLVYLREHPEAHAEAVQLRPDGPLAVTYRHGDTLDRFDYLMISEDMDVLTISHDYEGDRTGGSDHGFVAARLALTS